MIDAHSDLYGGRSIAVLIRYLQTDHDTSVVKLLSVVELGTSSTGEALYSLVQKELAGHNLDLKQNFMGICVDEGSNMISSKGAGLANRLQKDYPCLVVVKDLCHLYHNISLGALKEFPQYIIEFVKSVCSHFSQSALRKGLLREIQISRNPNKTPVEVLRYNSTRWLSLYKCTERVLELWEYLAEYFRHNDTNLFEDFNDEYHLLTHFLCLALGKIDHYNQYFQDSSLFYNQILLKIKESYTIFSQMLLNKQYVAIDFTEAFLIDFEKANNSKVANVEEFQESFLERYTIFKPILEKAIQAKGPSVSKIFFSLVRHLLSRP